MLGTACGGAAQTQSNQAAGGGAVASNSTAAPGAGGVQGGRFNVRETPAPELPTEQAAVAGLFVRRDGANLYVGTSFGQGQGQGQGRPQRTPGASGTRRAPNGGTPFTYNGPTVEVITDSNTKFYKDVTMMNFQGGAGNGVNGASGSTNAPVQQQVQSVNTLDDLLGGDTSNGVMTVWGTKNGDQITASVVVYRPRQAPPATPTPSSS